MAIPVSGNLVVDNMAVLRQATLIGLGLAMLPMSLVAGDLVQDDLRLVLGEFLLPESSLFLVHPYRKNLPRKVRVLVDYLAEGFRGNRGTVTNLLTSP